MCLSAGFTYQLGIENWINYGLFSFFSTLSVYNGQRLFKSKQQIQSPWLTWVCIHKKPLTIIVIFSSVLSLGFLLSVLNLNYVTISILIVSGIISALYVIRIRGKNMREIPYLKIHLIAFAWTMIVIVFPIMNEGSDASAVYIGFAHYLFFLGVTIPFDIRDLKYDKEDHKTIPQVSGIEAAKGIGVLSVVAFGILMALVIPSLQLNVLFYIAIISQLVLLIGMNEKRNDMYCAGLIDGAIAILGLSYFLV